MDTEKKQSDEPAEQAKQNIGDLVGELVVSGATVLANSAAKAVVSRVKKAAAKSPPAKAMAKAVKKARKSLATSKPPKSKKSKKVKSARKQSSAKGAGKRVGKKSAKRK